MKARNVQIAVLFSLAELLLPVKIIHADIAPPLQPPGANPGPADFTETDIQMSFESVTITVEETGRLYYGTKDAETVNAHVVATFAMDNPHTDEVPMDVIFPMTNIHGYGDGRMAYPKIQNFNVSANDKQLLWEVVTTPNPQGENEEPIMWAKFKVKFLTGELTFIDISYDVQSTGYLPIASFSYVLETGAGWAGPIGEVYLTLVLPYEATEENVLIGNDAYFGMGGENNPAPELSGNEVQWYWKDLEPTHEDNWAVVIFAPHIWQEVIKLREEMDQGEKGAAGKITEWYDALIIDRGIRQGAEDLIKLNVQAYQQAIKEDEWNDDVRARYANFLLFLYEFGRESDKYPDMLDEIYQLAERAQEINQLNPTPLNVLNQLEKVHKYAALGKKIKSSSDAVEKPISGEKKEENYATENISTPDQDREMNIVFFLGGALGVSLMVIFFQVYKLGRIRK